LKQAQKTLHTPFPMRHSLGIGCGEGLCVDPLESYLAAHDEPCPKCGYNLRGLRGDTCPECGTRINLDTILAPLRRALGRRYLAGRSAAAGSFAIGLTLMGGRTAEILNAGGRRGGVSGLVAGFVLFAASIVWLCSARRISELPLHWQGRLAAGLWAAIVVGVMIAYG
jgi:hypothetical protein